MDGSRIELKTSLALGAIAVEIRIAEGGACLELSSGVGLRLSGRASVLRQGRRRIESRSASELGAALLPLVTESHPIRSAEDLTGALKVLWEDDTTLTVDCREDWSLIKVEHHSSVFDIRAVRPICPRPKDGDAARIIGKTITLIERQSDNLRIYFGPNVTLGIRSQIRLRYGESGEWLSGFEQLERPRLSSVVSSAYVGDDGSLCLVWEGGERVVVEVDDLDDVSYVLWHDDYVVAVGR